MIQRGNDIFPVEIKADTNFGGKRPRKFKELFADQVSCGGRLSLENLKLDGDLMNIPMFTVGHTGRADRYGDGVSWSNLVMDNSNI